VTGGEDGGGFSSLALILVLAVPGAMLLLSLLPDHTARAAGVLGRAVIHGRVVLAALALAIWLGVFVSMFLGGQA
jgi:hypothetical protein